MGNVVIVPAQSSHVQIRTGETRVFLAIIDFGTRFAGFALREQHMLYLWLLKALGFLGIAIVSMMKTS